MCGIGLLYRKHKLDKGAMSPFMKSILHRGPDHQKIIQANDHLFIANNRLAIIDNHHRSNQPFVINGCYLSFNGAIYNFKFLKRELQKEGISFDTEGDTEVILKGYLQFGISFFERMSGMWSFVIFDSNKNNVIVSRDRFGIKPLYYSKDRKGLSIGSELKQFSEIADVNLTYNEDQIGLFLESGFQNTSHQTIWKEVNQVLPGHHGVYNTENNSWKTIQYYDLKETKNTELGKWDDLLSQSVKERCIADIDPAIMLSGGLDSSILAYELQQSKKLESYSYIDKVASEEVYVDAYTNMYPHSNHKVHIDNQEWSELVNQVIKTQDQPFPSLSILADYKLQSIAKNNGVKLMISGQGADEIMGGYIKNWTLLPKSMIATSPKQLINVAFNYMSSASKLWKKYECSQLTNYHYEKPQVSSVQEYMYHLIYNEGLRDLLHYSDRNSMAHSIETRIPYLDHKLVEAAYHMPTRQKLEGLIRKAPLVKKYKKVLPKSITTRTIKYAYDTPEKLLYSMGMVKLDDEYKKVKEKIPNLIRDLKVESITNDPTSLAWRLYFLNLWMEEYPN